MALPNAIPPRAARGAAPVTVRGPATLWYFLRFIRDPIGCARDVLERHGPFVAFQPFAGFPSPGRQTILAVGPEFNRVVLGDPQLWHTGHLPTSGPKGSALDRLGENLVSLNGPRHAHYRKLLAQPLRNASIEQLGEDLGRLVVAEVGDWPEGHVDLWPLAQNLVRSVAVALLFGGDQARGAALARLVQQVCTETKSLKAYACRAGFPGKAYERLMRRAEEVEACALAFAETKRGAKGGRDLISIIVNAPDETGAAPSRNLIAGQVPVLFGSSYETCQTVLTWTLFLLAQHPRVARELADEISGALAGGPPTLSKVAGLPLLDAVLKESMRLLPPVPYQTRVAAASTTLGGHAVAARSYVLLSAYLTNREPELYDEPARFKPERWSRITPNAFEYLAFSAGPRACPGAAFGTSVVKTAIAAILSRFRITVRPGVRIDQRVVITLAPSNGLPVALHPADGGWERVPVGGQVAGMIDFGPDGRP